MKAAVLYELGAPLRLRTDVEVPAPARGQVHVRLAFSGVCRSQLMEARGGRGPDPHLPHLLGHEGSGVVLATGPGVTKVKTGDRVVLGWIKGAGLDPPGPRYRSGGETISAGAVTTFNEEAVVSENRCVPIPAGVPMDVAVLFGCAVPTGAGIVAQIAPESGTSVAIFGLGGVGMAALMACVLHDCAQVIAVDVASDKLALASALGATACIDAAKHDPVAEVRKLTGGKGVDYAIEAAGFASTIEQAFAAVRERGGRCVFASHPRAGERISLDPHDLISGKRLEGSWGGGSDLDRDIPRFAELYRAKKLPLEKLIARRYRLDDVNRALDDLEAGRVGRPLIEIDASLG